MPSNNQVPIRCHGNDIIAMWVVVNGFDLQYFILHSLDFKLVEHALNGRLKLVP